MRPPTTRPGQDNKGDDCHDSGQDGDPSTRPELVLVARRLLGDTKGDPEFTPDEHLVYHERYRGMTPVCHLDGAYVRVPKAVLPEQATKCERCTGVHAQLMGLGELGRQLLSMDAEDLPTDEGGEES